MISPAFRLFLERCYDGSTSFDAWIPDLTSSLGPLISPRQGVLITGGGLALNPTVACGSGRAQAIVPALTSAHERGVQGDIKRAYGPFLVTRLSRQLGLNSMVEHPLWSELVVPFGFGDLIALMAHDDGFVAIISIPVALGETPSYSDPLLYRVRRHLQAGVMGLRRPLGAKDLIADPSGRMLHGGTDGGGTDRRELVRAAARAYDAERRGLIGDPDAERVWRELWRGGWAVVEAVDTDGKRMLLLRRDPSNPDSHALDAREQWALKLLVRGAGYKGIAFDLGVSVSAASKIVAQALRKLGFKSRSEFVRMMG